MAKPNKLTPGDRVAYAAKFLRDTCQHTGSAPQRRGTFVAYWSSNPTFARVHWDDFEALAAAGAGQYADPEWVEDCRAHGQIVHAGNIARVGSPRFALADMR